MRKLIISLLLALGACDSTTSITDNFFRNHVYIKGTVTELLSHASVPNATVVVEVLEAECSTTVARSTFQTGGDGKFEGLVDFLEISSHMACVTFEVEPPEGSNLSGISVTANDINVVRTTSPPDTVSVTIELQPD